MNDLGVSLEDYDMRLTPCTADIEKYDSVSRKYVSRVILYDKKTMDYVLSDDADAAKAGLSSKTLQIRHQSTAASATPYACHIIEALFFDAEKIIANLTYFYTPRFYE